MNDVANTFILVTFLAAKLEMGNKQTGCRHRYTVQCFLQVVSILMTDFFL